MELPSLEYAQLVFSVDFFQCFLAIFPSLHFGMVMYILCHCHYMLEVYDLLFDFDFYRGITVKRLQCVSEKTLDFETSLRLL